MELFHYVTPTGTDVIQEWLSQIRDVRTRAKISARIARLIADNFGDCKPLRDGVWELRINWGPGYRVYYARMGTTSLLLVCGGDKGHQSQDITLAITRWNDYKLRSKAL